MQSRGMIGWFAAAAVAAGIALAAATAGAQDQGAEQVELTKPKVEAMIAASKELYAMQERADEAAQGDAAPAPEEAELTPAEKAEIDAIAKKHGFADGAELDRVTSSVIAVLMRLEAEDPTAVAAIKEEISRVEKDASIAAEAKEEMLASLHDQLEPPAITYPGNVEVVRPYSDELRELFEGSDPEQ